MDCGVIGGNYGRGNSLNEERVRPERMDSLVKGAWIGKPKEAKRKNKVKIIKEFDSKRIFGEVEFFSYQIAFGISIRYLTCKNMGWMFRFYFGPFKIWFNLR